MGWLGDTWDKAKKAVGMGGGTPGQVTGASAGAMNSTTDNMRWQEKDQYNRAYDYMQQQQGVQGRGGGTIDYSQADQDRAAQLANAQRQEGLYNQYQQAINGQAPSQAQAQLQAGKDANIRQALAMAGAARGGPGAYAAALRGASDQATMATQQTAGQAAMLKAQEYQAAMSGAAQLSQAMRAQDLQAQGMSAQQAQAQAQLEDAQKARNDQMTQAYLQAEQNARNATMGAEATILGAQSGVANAATGQAFSQAELDQKRQDAWLKAYTATGGAMMGAMGGGKGG